MATENNRTHLSELQTETGLFREMTGLTDTEIRGLQKYDICIRKSNRISFGDLGIDWRVGFSDKLNIIMECTQPSMENSEFVIG